MATDELRTITAHHEAGHAVAAVLRGGSSLTSVTLSEAHGEGITWGRHKPADSSFFAYAGPWAEARYAWPADVPLDGEDAEWLTFEDYVTGVILHQPSDAAAVAAHDQQVMDLRAQGLDVPAAYTVWHDELERVWPAVQQVAAWLLDGRTVTDADVRALVDGE